MQNVICIETCNRCNMMCIPWPWCRWRRNDIHMQFLLFSFSKWRWTNTEMRERAISYESNTLNQTWNWIDVPIWIVIKQRQKVNLATEPSFSSIFYYCLFCLLSGGIDMDVPTPYDVFRAMMAGEFVPLHRNPYHPKNIARLRQQDQTTPPPGYYDQRLASQPPQPHTPRMGAYYTTPQSSPQPQQQPPHVQVNWYTYMPAEPYVAYTAVPVIASHPIGKSTQTDQIFCFTYFTLFYFSHFARPSKCISSDERKAQLDFYMHIGIVRPKPKCQAARLIRPRIDISIWLLAFCSQRYKILGDFNCVVCESHHIFSHWRRMQ